MPNWKKPQTNKSKMTCYDDYFKDAVDRKQYDPNDYRPIHAAWMNEQNVPKCTLIIKGNHKVSY
jgi:hypothetical protein